MRRLLLVSGTLLVVAGLSLGGWFVWQLYGTDVVAGRAQRANVEALRDLWERTPPTEADQPDPGSFRPGETSALVRIPRFGPDYEMPVLEGTSEDVLAEGFGHFEGTVQPGEEGNYALAAHRVTHGEPLRDMPLLRPGDEVVVETRDAVYTYVLATDPEALVVPFTDIWVVDPFPVNPGSGPTPDPADGRSLLTLTTCSELFHTDDRMIAFGHLADVRRK